MDQVDKSRQTRKTTEKAASKVEKPARVPLGRFRDILTVFGKDPAYHYRFIKDTNENGSRILEFRRAGYEPVYADEVSVGEDKVDRSVNERGIVRYAYRGETLFLMKQPMEFREEDVSLNRREVDEIERQILNPQIDPEDGPSRQEQYGKVSIER